MSATTADTRDKTHLYNCTQTAAGIDHFAAIGPEHLDFFHQQGYLVIRQAFPRELIEAASQAVTHLIDGGCPDYTGVQIEPEMRQDGLAAAERHLSVRKIMGFVDYDTRFPPLAAHPELLDLLERLMDDRPAIFQEMALLKPPHIGSEKPWHQDCAYFNVPLDTTVIGVWIALDPATIENGCLHIVPGTHREGPMPHFRRRDWQICDTDVEVDRNVAVPLEPGGCLLWHGLTHHGSPPNHSTHPRRALQLHYQPSNAGKISKEERNQLYGGKVLGAQC